MRNPAVFFIAPMILSDVDAVMDIERVSHLEPWSEVSFIEELERSYSHVLVARAPDPKQEPRKISSPEERRSGAIVGYICFWDVADEIQILNVAVRADFHRQGIGRALLLRALESGCERSARVAVLEVRPSNVAARRLYESAGFREVGRRPNYYEKMNEPAILMEMELDPYCKAHRFRESPSKEMIIIAEDKQSKRQPLHALSKLTSHRSESRRND